MQWFLLWFVATGVGVFILIPGLLSEVQSKQLALSHDGGFVIPYLKVP